MRSWNDISQFYHTDIWQWAWLSSSSVPLPFFGFKSFISSCSTIPILSTRNQHKTFLIKLFIYFPNQIIVYHFPSTSVSKEGGQNDLQLLSITLQGLCPLYTISSSLLVSLCDNESSLVELYSFSLAGFFFSTASRIISGFSPIYLNTSAFQIGFLKWSDMNCTPQTLSHCICKTSPSPDLCFAQPDVFAIFLQQPLLSVFSPNSIHLLQMTSHAEQ